MNTVADALEAWRKAVHTWNDEAFGAEERPRTEVSLLSGELAALNAIITHAGDTPLNPHKVVAKLVYREDNYVDVVCTDGTQYTRCYVRDWTDGMHGVEIRPNRLRAEPVRVYVKFNHDAVPAKTP